MKWDSFELNKLAAAVLLALLIGMISAKVADILVMPEKISKSVYIVEGVEEAAAGGAPAEKVIEPIEPLLAKADIERGKTVAKKCLQCHTFNKGEANKIGPNLYGIVGMKVAEVAGFAFSKALQGLGGTWTVQRLNEYLYKPAAYAKGTKMSFAGLTNGQERADIIAYLNSLNDNPQPLPTAPAEPSKDEANGQEKVGETKPTEKDGKAESQSPKAANAETKVDEKKPSHADNKVDSPAKAKPEADSTKADVEPAKQPSQSAAADPAKQSAPPAGGEDVKGAPSEAKPAK